jgi:hypothetical protein
MFGAGALLGFDTTSFVRGRWLDGARVVVGTL